MGLRTDLNLKGDDYQWLSSLFYFGRSIIVQKGLGWELTVCRISSLGVSNQQIAPAFTPSEVLFILYHHVGTGACLLRRREELLRGDCHKILPWCV